ncbi:MAG: hypothetical protein C5B59_12700 [Bacteroidetes bacterium]|nr:MAG: hypothetical protein C5B59_12700 [Bacteroidota bacterium]
MTFREFVSLLGPGTADYDLLVQEVSRDKETKELTPATFAPISSVVVEPRDGKILVSLGKTRDIDEVE